MRWCPEIIAQEEAARKRSAPVSKSLPVTLVLWEEHYWSPENWVVHSEDVAFLPLGSWAKNHFYAEVTKVFLQKPRGAHPWRCLYFWFPNASSDLPPSAFSLNPVVLNSGFTERITWEVSTNTNAQVPHSEVLVHLSTVGPRHMWFCKHLPRWI